jgi:hypothetical protein
MKKNFLEKIEDYVENGTGITKRVKLDEQGNRIAPQPKR